MSFLRKASMKHKSPEGEVGTITPRSVSSTSIRDPKQKVMDDDPAGGGGDGTRRRKSSLA
jgi:hypothetical protein